MAKRKPIVGRSVRLANRNGSGVECRELPNGLYSIGGSGLSATRSQIRKFAEGIIEMADAEVCEGCKSPRIFQHDTDGIPMCRKCWKGLIADNKLVEARPRRRKHG